MDALGWRTARGCDVMVSIIGMLICAVGCVYCGWQAWQAWRDLQQEWRDLRAMHGDDRHPASECWDGGK